MTANEAARIALEAAQWLRRNKIDVQTWTEKYEQAKAVLDKHLALDADPLATPAAVFVHPDDEPEMPHQNGMFYEPQVNGRVEGADIGAN